MNLIKSVVSAFCLSNCVAHNEFDLEKVLASERIDVAVMEIGTYLNFKSNYGEKLGKLNDSQKILFYVEALEFEVNNGGFDQFYFNSNGDFSNEIPKALKQIGAFKTAELVKKANAVFNQELVPIKRNKRQNIMEKIADQSEVIWNQCDEEFYSNEENLSQLLFEFVLAHKTDFEN